MVDFGLGVERRFVLYFVDCGVVRVLILNRDLGREDFFHYI